MLKKSPTIKVSKETVLASLNQKFLDLAERGFLDEETFRSVLNSNAATVENHFATMETLPPPPTDKNLHQEIFSDLSVEDVPPPRKHAAIHFDPARSVSPKRKAVIKEERLVGSEEVKEERLENYEKQHSENGISSSTHSAAVGASSDIRNDTTMVRGRPAQRQRRFEPKVSRQSTNTSSSIKLSSDLTVARAGMEKAQLLLLMPDNRRSRSEERSSWYASLRSST